MTGDVYLAPPPDLTDDEIDFICRGLTQNAARCRYLRDMLGLHVERRPDGSALVSRMHYEAVRGEASQLHVMRREHARLVAAQKAKKRT